MAGDATKAAEWAEILRRYRRSGLTQRAFCHRHVLSHHALRWWLYLPRAKSLLQALDDSPPRRKPRPKSPKLSKPEAPRFLPVRIVEAAADSRADGPSRDASSPIQILLPGGRRIAVGAEFDPETLRRVVATLEVPGC